MIDKLKDINSIASMEIFCNLHSSLPYTDSSEMVAVEKQIFTKCYHDKFYLPIAKYYTPEKVIDLYKVSNDNFFLMAYIYFSNLVHYYSNVVHLYNMYNYFDVVNEHTIYNTVIAFQLEERYHDVYIMTEKRSETRFLFERVIACQKLAKVEEAYSISNELLERDLDFTQRVKTYFSLAQSDYLSGDKEKLASRLGYIEENYLFLNEFLNMHSYHLYEYFVMTEQREKAFEYLKKAAFFHTDKDNDFRFKIKAIKELRDVYSCYFERAFEQYSNIEEYNELKTIYEQDLSQQNKKYAYFDE